MASLALRHHRGILADAEDDGSDGGATAAATTETEEEMEEEEEEQRRLHTAGLLADSMTAKGIQHLCCELLEINKASEQDFRANVYLCYLSLTRMLQEAGALEKDLHQHVLAHGRLFYHLSNNHYDLYATSIAAALPGLGAAMIPPIPDDPEDELGLQLLELELDVLLSEHRMEEALELLEELELKGGRQASLHSMSSAKVADHLASIADNPRTPRPELLKALSGLCKLGDVQRANHLLFKFYYRPSSWKNNEKKSIKDLARMVFSSILEASRSFVSLHGHPSPHTPQLVRWAREEMEDFSIAFSEYVKSSVVSSSLSPDSHGHYHKSSSSASAVPIQALEAVKCALAYCSLLRPPLHTIISQQDLLDLIAPCLQELLTMYARHLKEVTRLFVASDTWVLGRFPVSGILGRVCMTPATSMEIQYCLLTTSGRKFLTLIQDVVEDVYPLLDRPRTNNLVLQLLAELFMEYMNCIAELIISRKKEVVVADLETQNEDHHQSYMWQLYISINCTTLVSLFPIVAPGAQFKSDQPSDSLAQGRVVDNLIMSIKEAAGQVWTCFCQQFIQDTMSCISEKSGQGIASSPQIQSMMPSFPFQVLFGRVTQLNHLYGTILSGKDGAMKNLLQELMEAMIFWLSNNLDSWIHNAQGLPRDIFFQQIQLDVHFVLEFAQLGGFSSENIRIGALDLLTKAQEKMAYCSGSEHDNRNSGWATDAAKHAVGVLMTIRRSSMHHQEHANAVQNAQEEEEEKSEANVADEDHERSGACDGGKSSDEFISIEEGDEDCIMHVVIEGAKAGQP